MTGRYERIARAICYVITSYSIHYTKLYELSNGYESHSGFRDAFGKVFGKPPGKSKSSDYIVTSLVESTLGPIILGATSMGLCLCEFADRRMLEFRMKTLHMRFDAAIVPGENKFITQAKHELKEYFAGRNNFV